MICEHSGKCKSWLKKSDWRHGIARCKPEPTPPVCGNALMQGIVCLGKQTRQHILVKYSPYYAINQNCRGARNPAISKRFHYLTGTKYQYHVFIDLDVETLDSCRFETVKYSPYSILLDNYIGKLGTSCIGSINIMYLYRP